MKKIFSLIMSFLLLISLTACTEDSSEKKTSSFLPFESLRLSFCSGAGAWSTELILRGDGTFTGNYMDNDMGSFTDEYPDGTAYVCEFSGSFKNITKINDYTYSLTLDDVVTAKEYGEEWIEDSIKYIASPPYGIYDGREFFLYTPDAPVKALDEIFLSWYPIGLDLPEENLGRYGLYNIETGDGFFSFD